MKLIYLAILMMAVSGVFGGTIVKRGGKDDDDDNKKSTQSKVKGPVACSCFTGAGPGGDDSGSDGDFQSTGRDDGNGGRTNGHSYYVRFNRFNRAPSGPGRHGCFSRNDYGGTYGNVRSCPVRVARCNTDCCRFCCFNDARIGGD